MSKLVDNKLDGMDMWRTLSYNMDGSPRTSFLYNIDNTIHCSAIRVNEMKLIAGLNYGEQWNVWLPLLKVLTTYSKPSYNCYTVAHFRL